MRPLSTIGIAYAITLALPPHAQAGPDDARSSGTFVVRTAHLAHQACAYAVWLPPGYTKTRSWPAIVFLHGTGESGLDGWAPTRVGLGPALQSYPERWPCIVLFPQKPSAELEWEERESEDLLLAIVDRFEGEFAVDRHRVALVGMSQGGHGVWMMGARHPERWTCLVPVCAYGRARTVSPRVIRLPVWAFHGLQDRIVNPEDTREIVAKIREERADLGLDSTEARMTLLPEANHNAWDPAFEDPELPDWILAQAPTP
jgi:predicted peptidase